MKKTNLPRVLIVDDEAAIRRSFKDVLEFDYQVDEAFDGVDCIEKCEANKYDVIVLDVKMPRKDGMDTLDALQEICPDTPVVMISGHGTIETAVELVKKGAFDFINKPFDLNRVLITLRNALDRSHLVTETRILKRKVTQSKIQEIVGESKAIRKVKNTIEKFAKQDKAKVLILGPYGSGKELIARWLHEKSPRRQGPFVEVNCAAIPSELIESILFGHIKGAFTGAIKDQAGKFEQANGGTLFLDEIGDMSEGAQAKVLRALQDQKISRLGSDKDITVDVRVIAATNKNLQDEIARRAFREDLYHRLAVLEIESPALNDRREDIPILADYFMKILCEANDKPTKTFTPEALEALQNMDWTGNVRQLRNVVERLMVYGEDQKEITEEDVVEYVTSRGKGVHPHKELFERFDSLDDLLKFMSSEFRKYRGMLV